MTALIALSAMTASAPAGKLPLPGSTEDYFLYGTQPDPSGAEVYPIEPATSCNFCHGQFVDVGLSAQAEPYRNWVGTMMAQAMRDPVFLAALTITNQDYNGAGILCLRCHTPGGFLAGHAEPPDGSGLGAGWADFDGITCNFCHRMVDITYTKGVNPPVDSTILADLEKEHLLPYQRDNAQYVVDPVDSRRAPRDPDLLPYNPHFGVEILQSPFHKKADLCGTCHDVSNAAYSRQSDGTYVMNAYDTPHPTMNKYDMMPDQRTFTEWQLSTFAKGGVQMNGRFGGTGHPTGIMESCQDCHMPKLVSPGCIIKGFPVFADLPRHSFAGANSWVIRAVDELFEPSETGLTPEIVDSAVANNLEMLRLASDMELSQAGDQLKVRIINYTGHKLPTGYQEGRRMWINVKFFNDKDELVAERGGYDTATAVLDTDTTKVYDIHSGLDASMAASAGLPEGESFHLILNNKVYKDNRIPPIGFANAEFAAVYALPVGTTYADGQHWDDTAFAIPSGAASAAVTVYHQTSSREYMEFLRDENHTDDRGQVAYDLWVMFGKSAPVDMDSAIIKLAGSCPVDFDRSGVVNGFDLATLLGQWTSSKTYRGCPKTYQPQDLNQDCKVNGMDLAILLGAWGPCP